MRINTLATVLQGTIARGNNQPDLNSFGSVLTTANGVSFGFIKPSQFWRNDSQAQSSSRSQHDSIVTADSAIVRTLYSNGSSATSPMLEFFDVHDKTYYDAYYTVMMEQNLGNIYQKDFYLKINRSTHSSKTPSGAPSSYDQEKADKGYICSVNTEFVSVNDLVVTMYLLGGPAFNPFTQKWDILFSPIIHIKDAETTATSNYKNLRIVPFGVSENVSGDKQSPWVGQYQMNMYADTNAAYKLNSDLNGLTPYGRLIYSKAEEPTSNLFSYFINANLQPTGYGTYSGMNNCGARVSSIDYDVDI